LSDGAVLNHAPELRITDVHGVSGRRWILVGDAFQTDPSKPGPATQLAKLKDIDVSAIVDDWSGMWALIGESILLTDAAGLMGCYHTFDPAGRLAVSSSLPLLSQVSERCGAIAERQLEWKPGINWYPPPSTGIPGLAKLLPSQMLSWPDGAVSPRRLFCPPDDTLATEELLDRAGQILATALRGIASDFNTVWIGLTAGYDSRVTLAAAARAGLDVRTFTFIFGGSSVGDQWIPPLLAERAGVPHEFIRRRFRARRDRLVEWDAHHGGAAAEVDRELYARGLYDFAQDGDVILRSGCYGVSKCHYWNALPAAGIAGPPSADVILNRLDIPSDPSLRAGLTDWLKWVVATPQAGLDWRDRFYLEQRLGGWLSATEQALSHLDARTINPANVATLFQALQSFPAADRLEMRHQKSLIAHLLPQLMDLPFNPPKTFMEKVRTRAYRMYTQAARTVSRPTG
jgi:hypothetical protein